MANYSHTKPSRSSLAPKTMMSLKQRIIEMARKWQKKTASGRIISYPTIRRDSSSWATNKGHFVVYSMDQKRFVVPIEYLSKKVVKELLRWSEEEFGLARNGPITLPIDGTMLKYVISLVAEHVPEDVEKALISISSISSSSPNTTTYYYLWFLILKP